MRSTTLFAILLALSFTFISCSDDAKPGKPAAPVVGFVQFIEDETVDEARKGFYDALRDGGYSEDSGTVKIIYRNAQGDQAALNQILDYFITEKVDLIGANTTLAMITAVNKTSTIPVFMMVAPSPQIAQLTKTDSGGKETDSGGKETDSGGKETDSGGKETDSGGKETDSGGKETGPANLAGTYETLAYIDTSVGLIKQVFPNAKRVGTIFNSSEPNSTNAMERLRARCAELGLQLVERSVTASNETQQTVQALLNEGVDVFFALPDNIIFSSFETVFNETSNKKIPIVTSEAGLVKRGAFIAYGADFYQWGHQAGESAAKYLKTRDLATTPAELVKVRKRMYNPKTAQSLGLPVPAGFEAIQ